MATDVIGLPLRLRIAAATLRLYTAAWRLRDALQRHYNPDQPRVPAGSSDGGQWTDGLGADSSLNEAAARQDSRFQVAEDERPPSRYSVDLREEEGTNGGIGHAGRRHIVRT